MRYSCAQFSVCILRKFIIMSLRSYALGYQPTITQDADVFWEDKNFIKFPSKIVPFLSFFMKSNTSNPIFLFRYFEVFKIVLNICENQKNE